MRLALKVSLPEGLHTQSNKPLDPTLIPTVLTIDAPAGVTVDEIVYPPAIELKQQGLEQPLAVFEREFVVGVQVTLGPGVAAGDLVAAGRLRYQACNDMMCFPPSTVEFAWTPPCRAGRRRPIEAAADPVFAAIAFGRGEKPAGQAPGDRRRRARRRPAGDRRAGGQHRRRGATRRLHRARHDRRLPRRGRVPRRSSATPKPA